MSDLNPNNKIFLLSKRDKYVLEHYKKFASHLEKEDLCKVKKT
ncbi:Uncharacterised protein [Porphyromonas cangingivalis]|nr:Uncharacterised protein [Porphyromonas cangingivalis]